MSGRRPTMAGLDLPARAEIEHLLRALDKLHALGWPPTSPGISAATGHTGPASKPPPDARGGERWRRRFEAYMTKLARLAAQIETEVNTGERPATTGWRCPDCNRWRSEGASFCDACGAARPAEGASRSA